MQYPVHLAIATALIAIGAAGCGVEPSAHAESTPPRAAEPADLAAVPMPELPPLPEPVDDADELGGELGEFEMTYYWMAEEKDEPGTVPLRHYKTCKPIATVSKSFARRLTVEGSGRLADGRVVNTAGGCKCRKSGQCFFVVAKRKKWGVGVGKKPLSPFRTVAVDPSRVAIGTMLYIPDLDGLTVPGRKPWGGFVHDGCVIAGDRGGGVEGAQIDFFMGRKRHYRAFYGRNRLKRVTVFDGKGRCEKSGRSVARADRNTI